MQQSGVLGNQVNSEKAPSTYLVQRQKPEEKKGDFNKLKDKIEGIDKEEVLKESAQHVGNVYSIISKIKNLVERVQGLTPDSESSDSTLSAVFGGIATIIQQIGK